MSDPQEGLRRLTDQSGSVLRHRPVSVRLRSLIVAGLCALAGGAAPFAWAAGPTPRDTVARAEECAVYAAALAQDSPGEGLYTSMDGYDIRCDWAALGVKALQPIGPPSAECSAALERNQSDADRVCRLPLWTVTLERPTFSPDHRQASLSITRTYNPSQGWHGPRAETCELAKTAGKWRIVACNAGPMT
jgi:hypothetical protein